MILGGAECVWSGRRRPATDTLVSIKYNNNIIYASTSYMHRRRFPSGRTRVTYTHTLLRRVFERAAAVVTKKPSRAFAGPSRDIIRLVPMIYRYVNFTNFSFLKIGKSSEGARWPLYPVSLVSHLRNIRSGVIATCSQVSHRP